MNLRDFIGQTLTGKQVNEILITMPLLKFMNDDGVHYGVEYVTGENKDLVPFCGQGECQAGGIYVTTLGDSDVHINSYGDYARRVWIDPDALVYIESWKLKCNKVILGPRVQKHQLVRDLFTEYLDQDSDSKIMSMRRCHYLYQYIDPKFWTTELMARIVGFDISAFHLIPLEKRTSKVLLAAVKKKGEILAYIGSKDRTEEILVAAVKESVNALALFHTHEMTKEILIQCVIHNGSLLKHMEFRIDEETKKTTLMLMYQCFSGGLHVVHGLTDEDVKQIMIFAVRNDHRVLKYVNKQVQTEIIQRVLDDPEVQNNPFEWLIEHPWVRDQRSIDQWEKITRSDPRIQKIKLLQKWFKRVLIGRKLLNLIPKIIPLYYADLAKGGYFRKSSQWDPIIGAHRIHQITGSNV
jgi:hypothetical protein